MKNRILCILLSIFLGNFILSTANSVEQFNFNVTEIEILNDGNIIKGEKKGTIETDDGVIITADSFEYDKLSNILQANGNVEIIDSSKDLKIYSDSIVYEKNNEIITTNQNSKAHYGNGNFIYANSFRLDRNKNTLNAKENVEINNTLENYLITGNDFTYFKKSEKIISKGETKAFIQSKYEITSSDIIYLINKDNLSSKNKTKIKDKNSQVYFLEKFNYQINQEILKGENILMITNHNLPKSDKIYFESAMINLKDQKFIAKNTEIDIHKEIFDNSDNDPRLKGVSSISDGSITEVNKGIFTSCKKNDNCPPWSIKAKKIKHDKKQKKLIYNNAVLKVYNLPVMYFPKFFHPDPSVKRQSGLLKPIINNSNILGSSLTIPYYQVISDDSDLTFAPSLFENDLKMMQSEYRKVGENYNFISNFGYTKEYYSSLLKKKKNINYFFSEFNTNLDLDNFNSSKLFLNIEKMNNDTYLKVFDSNLIDSVTSLKPENKNTLFNELKLTLDHEKFNLTTGLQSSEDLQLLKSDRHEYVLPYYNYSMNLVPNFNNGSLFYESNGSNKLNNTNQLKSQVINNLTYSSLDFFTSKGIKSNFNIKLKNLNSLGKNVSQYKSSPQIELASIVELKSSIPLIKEANNYINFITPKLSFRINPNDMKNYNSNKSTINTDNIFSLDRLGLNDTLETGKSLTVGIDYRKEKLNDVNKYFEMKLASVLRNKKENFIPNKTSLNNKSSNIFGSLTSNLSKNFKIDYNFALDNNLDKIKYNDINTSLNFNDFQTSFRFIKEVDEMGDENFIENNTSYSINNSSSLVINSRRNRKLNLTEFYDLVYEYKNDCLVAAAKYKKTFYEDRDLKPTEDLFFTITLFPLSKFEQKIDNSLYK